MPDVENPSPRKPHPRRFSEYLVIVDTGWTLEYIRNLPEEEFAVYSLLAERRQGANAYMSVATLRKPTL